MKHRKKSKQNLYSFFILTQGAIAFVAIFLSIIIFANWPAVKNEFGYIANSMSSELKATISPTNVPTETPTPIYEPAHIIIDEINVDVPITWDVPGDQTISALNKGVAHLAGTAKLGEIGNIFITGHSSDYIWKKNPYAAIFSLLPKLQVNDTIRVREHGREFIYQIIETKIVKPSQVEVADATSSPILTLMTCYPIGSTKSRYVIHASLINSPQNLVNQNQSKHNVLTDIKFR